VRFVKNTAEKKESAQNPKWGSRHQTKKKKNNGDSSSNIHVRCLTLPRPSKDSQGKICDSCGCAANKGGKSVKGDDYGGWRTAKNNMRRLGDPRGTHKKKGLKFVRGENTFPSKGRRNAEAIIRGCKKEKNRNSIKDPLKEKEDISRPRKELIPETMTKCEKSRRGSYAVCGHWVGRMWLWEGSSLKKKESL